MSPRWNVRCRRHMRPLWLWFVLCGAALKQKGAESGHYRSLSAEGLPSTDIRAVLSFTNDGSVQGPVVGSFIWLSEFGTSMTWVVQTYDKLAPNVVVLRTDDSEDHGLGDEANSPYGGTWSTMHENHNADGNAGAEQCTEMRNPSVTRSTALSAREREQRLQAVHQTIDETMAVFEKNVMPDGSYRAEFFTKPLGIGVKHRAAWLAWVGDYASFFEITGLKQLGNVDDEARGQMRLGDTVVSVNGESVLGWTQDQLLQKLGSLQPSAKRPITMLCLRKDWDVHRKRQAARNMRRGRSQTSEQRQQQSASAPEGRGVNERLDIDSESAEEQQPRRDNNSENSEEEKPDFSQGASPYDILLVDQAATLAEIKKAYRKLSLKYHPDKNPGDSEATKRFIAIQAAYEILSDESTRSEWDDREASRDDFYSDHRGRKIVQALDAAMYQNAVRSASKSGWSREGDGVWFIMFYAPWCNHNQKLRLGFLTAAKLLRRGLENINVGAVNCDKEPSLCRSERITGFPTIRLLIPSVGREIAFTQHENIPYPTIPDLMVAFVERMLERTGMLTGDDSNQADGEREKCPPGSTCT